MKYIERYEGITGEELPRTVDRIKHPIHLSLKDFMALKKSEGLNAWGSVINNPCVIFKTVDGRWIEEYNWSTRFIEE